MSPFHIILEAGRSWRLLTHVYFRSENTHCAVWRIQKKKRRPFVEPIWWRHLHMISGERGRTAGVAVLCAGSRFGVDYMATEGESSLHWRGESSWRRTHAGHQRRIGEWQPSSVNNGAKGDDDICWTWNEWACIRLQNSTLTILDVEPMDMSDYVCAVSEPEQEIVYRIIVHSELIVSILVGGGGWHH